METHNIPTPHKEKFLGDGQVPRGSIRHASRPSKNDLADLASLDTGQIKASSLFDNIAYMNTNIQVKAILFTAATRYIFSNTPAFHTL